MKTHLAVLGMFLVIAPSAAADDTTIAAGPASLEIQWSETTHCIAQVPHLPCPAGYDNAETLEPSDDTLYLYRAVQDAHLTIAGPIPTTEIDLDLRSQRVNHSFISTADSVVFPAEAAIPGPIGDATSTTTRPAESYIVVHVVGLDGTQPAPANVYVPIMLPYTDRNGTYTPNGYGATVDDSDVWVPYAFDALRLCWIPQLGKDHALTCDAIPGLEEMAEAWPTMTPRLLTGVAVNHTSVQLGDAHVRATHNTPSYQNPLTPWEGTTGFASPEQPQDEATFRSSETPVLAPRASQALVGVAPTRPTSIQASALASTANSVPWLLLASSLALAWPLARLFHRITRARALQSAARQRLFELVKAKPGIALAEVAAELGLSFHSTQHHARMLQRCQHIEILRADRKLALFPTGWVPYRLQAAMVHLQRPSQARALRAVQRQPGLNLAQACAQLGCNKSSAHQKLRQLRDHGLIAQDPGGYRVTAAGAEALALLDRLQPPAAPPSLQGSAPRPAAASAPP
jgi:hypothetical protein